MSKNFLHQVTTRSVCMFLVVMFCFLVPPALKAQLLPECPPSLTGDCSASTGLCFYPSGTAGQPLGTTASRLVASIVETETTVQFNVIAIGEFRADAFDFAIFFKPGVLRLTDNTFQANYESLIGIASDLDNLPNPVEDLLNAVDIAPSLITKGWIMNDVQQRLPGTWPADDPLDIYHASDFSRRPDMRAFIIRPFTNNTANHLLVQAGQISLGASFYFQKVNPGQDLLNSDFGIGVQTSQAFERFSPKWTFSQTLTYGQDGNATPLGRSIMCPKLFAFRSPSDVSTQSASAITSTSATLNGTFERGNTNRTGSTDLAPRFDMVDAIGSATTGGARINWDSITQSGFIYTLNNVELTIVEFDTMLTVNGTTRVQFPTSTEMTAGSFVRVVGGNNVTFYVKQNVSIANANSAVNPAGLVQFSVPVTGLQEEGTYYAWAFMKYAFETSNSYPAVGNKVEINLVPSACTPFQIGTIKLISQSTCTVASGSIQITVTGGGSGAEFEYALNGGTVYTDLPANGIITGLSAGTYTVSVRDKNDTERECGVAVSDAITLMAGESNLAVSLTPTAATACGATNGILTLNITGGTAPYEYSINNGPFLAIPVGNQITGLTPGLYTVDVKDAGNCTAGSGQVILSAANGGLQVATSAITATTCGAATGGFTLTAGSGTAPYEYQINGGVVLSTSLNSVVIGRLSAGVHTWSMTDATGCYAEGTVEITNGSGALSASVTKTNAQCDGLTGGSITINVTGSTATPFSYRYDGGDSVEGWLTMTGNTVTIPNLPVGSYDVIVKDATDCTYRYQFAVITREDRTDLNVGTIQIVSQPSCSAATGSIFINVTGGSGTGYQYSINGSAYAALPSNGIISNLSAGTYVVSVQDVAASACGTAVSEAITLTASDNSMSLSTQVTAAASCGSATGSIELTVSGGTPASYTVNGGTLVLTSATVITLNALTPGIYVIDVTDGTGCVTSSGQVEVPAATDLGVAASVVSSTTCGNANGSLMLEVTTGTAPYQYQINGGVFVTMTGTTATVTGLAAGSHVWKVIDDTGCFAEGRLSIGNTGTNTLAVTAASTDAYCDGINGGSITINITGSTATPFSYRYNGGAWVDFTGTSVTIQNLSVGIYDIEVKDASGCTYDYENLIINRDENRTDLEVASINVVTQPACGTTTGSIDVSVTGGSGTYEYALNGGTSWTALASSGTIGNLGAGTYVVSVRDAASPACGVANSAAITLTASNSTLTLGILVANATSCGTDNGSITVTVSGGTSPYTYTLNGTGVTPAAGGVINNLTPGVYVVNVTDAALCTISSGQVIVGTTDAGLNPQVSAVSNTTCGNATGGFTLTLSGTAPYQYQISGGAVQTSSSNVIVFNNLTAGNHSWNVTDATGCYAAGMQPITNGAAGTFAVTVSKTNIQCGGSVGTITITTVNGATPFIYSIDGGTTWSAPFAGPTAIIPSLTEGTYSVIVKDNVDCTYENQNIVIGVDNTSDLAVRAIQIAGQPTCASATGEIKLTVTGGSGNYQFSINGSAYAPLAATGIIDGLGAGTFTVSVQDALAPLCGTAISESITLTAGDTNLSILSAVATAATSCGATDGTITVAISGGTTPYTYTLNETAATPTAGVFSGLAPGIYVVNVIDATGCIASSGEVSVIATSGLIVTPSAITATTCGNAAGQFTLTVTGTGTAPYKFQIGGGVMQIMNGNSAVIENLTAGTYTYYVEDANGCFAEGNQVIANTGGNTLGATAVATSDAHCDGTTGGVITITVTNGTPNFEFSIDGGLTWTTPIAGRTATIQNLAQGVYDVLVKDGSGCTYVVQQVRVGRSNTIDLAVGTIYIESQPTCSAATGSIQVNVTGGSGNYQYALNGGTTYTALPANGIITGLGAGTFTVFVQDSEAPHCGTAISEAVILTAGDTNLSISGVATAATSCGATDGTIVLTVSGGTAPYTYTLNGTAVTPAAGVISGLAPGIYVVNVIDATGCLASSGEVSVIATSGLIVTPSAITATTCGNTTGSFTLTVTGTGTAPYQCRIGGGVMQTMTGNSVVIGNLAAGTYAWYIVDANGCFAEGNQAVGNTGGNTLGATAVATSDAQCDGTTGGIITVTVTNGTPDFEFSIDGGLTWTTPTAGRTATIQNLAQGVYDVVVKDGSGCTYIVQQVRVGRSNTIDLAVGTIQIETQPTCAAATGSISLTVTGGSGNYQYALNGGTYAALPANGIITGLDAGTYRVSVQDSEAPHCGTAISDAVTLTAGDTNLSISGVATAATSCGTNDGSIVLTVSGGTAPYTYTLNGTAVTPAAGVIGSLTPGIYIINVIDATDCVASAGEVRVNAADGGLNVTAGSVVGTACGAATGSFTLTVATGAGTTPYQYRIDNGVLQTMVGNSAVISSLSAGIHTWYVVDAAGCFAEGSQAIANTTGSQLAATAATTTNAQCDGLNGGVITITITTGATPYQYSIDGGTNWSATFAGPTGTIQDLAQGTYNIIVRDNSGCTYEISQVRVERSNTIDLAIGTIQIVSQPTCANPTGSIRVFVTGGSGNYQYALNGGTYAALPANGIITGLGAGTYRVSIQDSEASHCGTAVSEAVILAATDAAVTLTAVATSATNCATANGTLTLTVNGGTAPYTYTLNGATVTPISGVISGLASGAYIVNVTDFGGCTATSGEVIVGAVSGLQVVVSGNTPIACGTTLGGFTLTATGTAPYQYSVNGGVLQTMIGNTATISGLTAGSHIWYVVDATGCFAENREVISNSNNNNFAFTVSTVNTGCDAASGGSMTLTVTGGTAPFSYRYDTGTDAGGWIAFSGTSSTITISNLAAGSYDVRVKDNTNCIYEYQNATIGSDNRTDLEVATISIASQPTCTSATGSISLVVTGGSGSYEYALNGGSTYTALPANGVITGLAAGTYRVSVRDVATPACGTAISEAVTLRASDTNLMLSVTATSASACGSATGSLALTVSGGATPYTYTLNGATVTPVSGVIADLTPGIYVVNVTDNGGCLVSSGEVLVGTTNSGLNPVISAVTDASCGTTTGGFTLTVTGTAPYEYQINGGTVMTTSNNVVTFSNLPAGSHVWTITDATGCNAQGRQEITNGTNALAATTAVTSNAQCDGLGGGIITITVTNGFPPYAYSYDNGTTWTNFVGNAATATIQNLNQGNYDIWVRDYSSCIFKHQNTVIDRSNYIDLAIGSIYIAAQPTCAAATGSIQVNVTGGSGNYQYALNGGTTYEALPADGIITGLGAGTYRVSIQDAQASVCGTVISEAVTLTASDTDLQLIVTATNASSCTINDGTLTLAITGGSTPYQYRLNGGSYAAIPAGNVISGVASGRHIVDVIDNTGCVVSSGEVTVGATNGGLNPVISAITNTTCGNATGSFTLTVTGTPLYQYSVNGGVTQTMSGNSATISGLSAGSYVWSVTDATGCFAEGRQEITNGLNALAATATVTTDAQCDGTGGGVITIVVTNGAAPFQYSLNGGTTWTSFTGNTTAAQSLAQGSYNVIVKDNANCTYEYQGLVVGRADADIAVGTINIVAQPTCAGSNGSIFISATGGSGNYQYALNGGTTFTALPANGIITGLSAGTYRVSIQDSAAPTCGTAISEAITLTATDGTIQLVATATNASACGVADGSISLIINGGTAPYEYRLNNGAWTAIPVGNTITGLASGEYVVDVRDVTLCIASSGIVQLGVNSGSLQVTASNITNASCSASTLGSFTLTATTGTAPYQYRVNGGTMQTMTGNNVTFSGLTAGTHTWRIVDANGCFADGSQLISNAAPNALAVTTVATDVQCDNSDGSIAITVTPGMAPYQYSFDGGDNWTSFTGTTVTISRRQGIYNVLVRDNLGCTFEDRGVVVGERRLITPPSAVTPQTFCTGATVANLQATGSGIKWYDAGGNLLDGTTALTNGTIYYAAQTAGSNCESATRTAVKAIIDDNVLIEAPRFVNNPQSLCGPATLADVATDGNTNIVWYAQAIGGSPLPLTTSLSSGTYYATIAVGGSCESITRSPVVIEIGAIVDTVPRVVTPQYFCEGAIISNLVVTNNQLRWYTTPTGGTALSPETVLVDGMYYAAQGAGACETTSRAQVEVILSRFSKPLAPADQTMCNGLATVLADLRVTGAGVIWFDALTDGNRLPLSTPLVSGTTYYAAQTSEDCESERIPVTVTNLCYDVWGSVFPFVHMNYPSFDNSHPVTVSLYAFPPTWSETDYDDFYDPYDYLINPLYITRAVYYDTMNVTTKGLIYQDMYKFPGVITAVNNPGLPLTWRFKQPMGPVNTTALSSPFDLPMAPTGVYQFKSVPAGRYVIAVSRPGFLTRVGMVTVSATGSLGHREIIAGDINGNAQINSQDVSILNGMPYSTFTSPAYSPSADFNGDGFVNQMDNSILLFNLNFRSTDYQETNEFNRYMLMY